MGGPDTNLVVQLQICSTYPNGWYRSKQVVQLQMGIGSPNEW